MTDDQRAGAGQGAKEFARVQRTIGGCPLCGRGLKLLQHYNTMRPEPEAWGGYYAVCEPCCLTIDPDCTAEEVDAKINRRASDKREGEGQKRESHPSPLINVYNQPMCWECRNLCLSDTADGFLRCDSCKLVMKKPQPKPAGEAGGWVSVKERKPVSGWYLTATKFGGIDVCFCGAKSGFGTDDITHWMPLPKPPEPKTGEGA